MLQRYVLVSSDSDKVQLQNLPEGTIIKIPVKKAVVYSSVHCAMLNELDAIDCIIGVCDYNYIILPSIKNLFEKGKIKDMGEATSPNVEQIIDSGAEVIISTPFENGGYGAVEKTGIPIIECVDYMETTPLGRAEWIKFIGLLTENKKKADSLFQITESNYLNFKRLTENIENKPTLLVGMKYGTPWYVPSGESFMAQLFKDAGADYIFKDLPGTGGTPLSFETVLDKAVNADYWLIQYNRSNELTYNILKSDYSLYSQFGAFKNRKIFGCNTAYSMYYEEMPVYPNYLLAELIAIFHPQLIENHHFRYFRPLK
ncbi:MAG: ABC transporter substrate-binding protein [Planctomycetaceae bacterium]|nr:ABC transporter substrate-binding protein [Planctomycetaceae bacterium]